MTLSRTRKPHIPLSFPWKFKWKALAFLLLLIIALIYAYSSTHIKDLQQFPIREVKVIGAEHLDHQLLQRLLVPFVNKGFFDVEVDEIKQRLQQIPWIATVAVRRIWPDQVLITLTERTPIAYWNKTSLLSTTGEVFTPDFHDAPLNLTHLPRLIGPPGKQLLMLQNYLKINKTLDALHLKITELELTPYQSWVILLSSGIKVNAGYKDVLTRLTHFVKVYPKIVGDRASEVDYVDLRYSNGLAIRWKTLA